MPDPVKISGKMPRKTGLVGSVLIMLAVAIAAIAPFEGKRNDPYFDSVRVQTVCYGDTRVEMRHYSDAECEALLREAAAEFAEGVRLRNPGLADLPYQWAAHTSFAYNVGLGRYRSSSVARLFAEGRQREACNFMKRYVYAGGKVLKGLVRRREAEAAICLRDAA